jgi:hypothetical protein
MSALKKSLQASNRKPMVKAPAPRRRRNRKSLVKPRAAKKRKVG